MYAKHPKLAAEFSEATPKGKKLPEKIKPTLDDQVSVMKKMVDRPVKKMMASAKPMMAKATRLMK